MIRLVVAMTLLAVVGAVEAGAHGPAKWIQDGNYKNAAGDLCCGEKDCAELADGDIVPAPGGYLIKSLNELVPQQEVQPSPDGRYWRCFWGGKRKCFFAPPGAV